MTGHIRLDNGPEFVAKAVQKWITAVGAKTVYITPGSPWENHASRNSFGIIESFNARLRDELLDGEIFYSLAEAKVIIESCRRHYNTVRPKWITRIQASGIRRLCPSHGQARSSATPISFATRAGVEAVNALTFQPDHSEGADHDREPLHRHGPGQFSI